MQVLSKHTKYKLSGENLREILANHFNVSKGDIFFPKGCQPITVEVVEVREGEQEKSKRGDKKDLVTLSTFIQDKPSNTNIRVLYTLVCGIRDSYTLTTEYLFAKNDKDSIFDIFSIKGFVEGDKFIATVFSNENKYFISPISTLMFIVDK